MIRDDQKQRILALIDPSIDPDGLGVLWQTHKSLEALRNGGLTGQGLFHGDLTSIGYLPAQHTDSIFSSIGEQLGMLGCLAALLLLLAIVLRCIQVGMKSPDYMNRLICIGIASMLLFQILHQRRRLPRPVPGRRSGPAVFELRRQLHPDVVPRHGHRLRHQNAPRPRYECALYPALLTRIFGQHRVWRCCFFSLPSRSLYGTPKFCATRNVRIPLPDAELGYRTVPAPLF